MKNNVFFLSLFVLGQTLMFSQQSKKIQGPVIEDYGATFEVTDPEIKTEVDTEMKVIFDIDKSSTDKSEVNTYIEVAARFLNMHVNAGMKHEQLKAAMWEMYHNYFIYKSQALQAREYLLANYQWHHAVQKFHAMMEAICQ